MAMWLVGADRNQGQTTLYNKNESNKAIMLLPQGWLFRGGYDARLREHLLIHGFIETIISFHTGLMKSLSIPIVLMIMNK